ncbi:MAG TPA: DUF1573 domain-containing protein [Acidobacteriota bacterium]
MKHRFPLVFCLGLVLAAFSAIATPQPATAAAEGGPALSLEATSLDQGRVAKGATADYTFTIKNTGSAELKISEVRPSCGCTVASFDRSIAPGQSGTVRAKIETSRFIGPIAKTLTVKSNDPNKPELLLTMKADVYQLVDIQPSDRAMMSTTSGESVTKSFTLKSNDPESPALEILGVEANVRGLSHKLTKGAEGYTLDLTLAADAPVGPLAGQVKVKTNNPKLAELSIQVNGNVRGPILVAPSAVFLPAKSSDQMAQESRVVNLRPSKEGLSFKVTEVRVSDPVLKADLSEIQPGSLYTVRIGFASAPQPGRFDSSVVILTDNALQPRIEVPVKAQVR